MPEDNTYFYNSDRDTAYFNPPRTKNLHIITNTDICKRTNFFR